MDQLKKLASKFNKKALAPPAQEHLYDDLRTMWKLHLFILGKYGFKPNFSTTELEALINKITTSSLSAEELQNIKIKIDADFKVIKGFFGQ